MITDNILMSSIFVICTYIDIENKILGEDHYEKNKQLYAENGGSFARKYLITSSDPFVCSSAAWKYVSNLEPRLAW